MNLYIFFIFIFFGGAKERKRKLAKQNDPRKTPARKRLQSRPMLALLRSRPFLFFCFLVFFKNFWWEMHQTMLILLFTRSFHRLHCIEHYITRLGIMLSGLHGLLPCVGICASSLSGVIFFQIRCPTTWSSEHELAEAT